MSATNSAVDQLSGEFPGQIGPAPLDLKDQIALLLKEYDALFANGERATMFMQDAAKALGLAIVGLCIAARTDITIYVAVISAPILIVGMLGVVAHCREIVLRCGRHLARIENRVFALCGQPLLTLQTCLAIHRSRRSSLPWCIGISAGMLLYVFSLGWMIRNFFWPILFPNPARASEAFAWLTLLIGVAAAMPLYPLRKIHKLIRGRRTFDVSGKLTQRLIAEIAGVQQDL